MTIKNKTRSTTLSPQIKTASNFVERMLGVMFRKNPGELLLHTNFGIHTFFVRFPLDIIILDKDNRVVAIKKQLPPNRLYFWNPKYSTVLELPQGTIVKSKTQLGDSIEIG